MSRASRERERIARVRERKIFEQLHGLATVPDEDVEKVLKLSSYIDDAAKNFDTIELLEIARLARIYWLAGIYESQHEDSAWVEIWET